MLEPVGQMQFGVFENLQLLISFKLHKKNHVITSLLFSALFSKKKKKKKKTALLLTNQKGDIFHV